MAQIHGLELDRLERLERWLVAIYNKEVALMALGQDILDAVRAETTSVDSVIALIDGLKQNGTIDADTAASILSEIGASKAKLDAALAANTTPLPPTP